VLLIVSVMVRMAVEVGKAHVLICGGGGCRCGICQAHLIPVAADAHRARSLGKILMFAVVAVVKGLVGNSPLNLHGKQLHWRFVCP
jgi:hypothetical protein